MAVLDDWMADDCLVLAASISYYSALSFFPLIIVLLAVLGYLLTYSSYVQNVQSAVLSLISTSISPKASELASEVLGNMKDKAPFGAPLGFVMLLLSAGGIFVQIDFAFEKIWHQELNLKPSQYIRKFLKDRIKSFLAVLALGLAVFVAMVLGIGADIALHYVGETQNSVIVIIVSFISSFTLSLIVLTFLYKVMPPKAVSWSSSLKAAALASFLWIVTREILGFVAFDKTYSVYGIVGTFLAMMLWIFIMSCILLFGAEYQKNLYVRSTIENPI